MDYKKGIDFIVVVFYRFEHAEIITKSIKKYVKNIPYTIHIVNNGINEGENNGYDILSDMFKDEPSVKIHKGLEQAQDSNSKDPNTYKCKIDGRMVSIGSWAQAKAMTIGVRESDREYICYLDGDIVFLNEWVDDVLPLMENNIFVTDKWRDDLNTHCCQFCLVKRDLIENNYLYEKDDLYPNIHFKDTAGMLGHYGVVRNESFVILKNSYNDRSLNPQHLLNLKHGEQAWINDTPFFYHYGRGSQRSDSLHDEWVEETNKYLNNN
tara:strand:- start:126 stop:923 length:798 start_codon:yes stop_codon:yes gene_type:complete